MARSDHWKERDPASLHAGSGREFHHLHWLGVALVEFERELASNQQKRARGLVQTRMLACALDVGHDKILETSCGRIDPVVRPLNHPYQETRLFYIVKTPRSRPVRNDLPGGVSGQMGSVSPAGCFSHLAWRLGSSHGRSSKPRTASTCRIRKPAKHRHRHMVFVSAETGTDAL
jgi:hypothetical protein